MINGYFKKRSKAQTEGKPVPITFIIRLVIIEIFIRLKSKEEETQKEEKRCKHRKDDSSDPSSSHDSDSSDDSHYRRKRRKKEKHREKDPIKQCANLTGKLLMIAYK